MLRIFIDRQVFYLSSFLTSPLFYRFFLQSSFTRWIYLDIFAIDRSVASIPMHWQRSNEAQVNFGVSQISDR